jgi:hypothetical protein
MVRSRIFALRILTLLPSDVGVLHSNFFSVVRHTDPWQQERQEVQAIDELWNESTGDSVLVVVPQLKQTCAISVHLTELVMIYKLVLKT